MHDKSYEVDEKGTWVVAAVNIPFTNKDFLYQYN